MKASHPKKLPVNTDYSIFGEALGKASYELGKLDGLQQNLLNPTLLVSPLTAKEATISSKIEGTQSTVSDIMMFEASNKLGKTDSLEVSNYRKAVLFATVRAKSQKLNLSFIKALHSLLLENVRGQEKRGEFRKEQVYIANKNQPIGKAKYIPPEPYLVDEYMENLEDFILNYNQDALVKAAIIHYQFESIHPFNYGNGRIGRLLIPLFLHLSGRLYQPILYLSGYFEHNRNKYMDALHNVDVSGRYDEWIKFFMVAVADQSIETQILIEKINKLHIRTIEKMSDYMSPYSDNAINFLFKMPVFKSTDLRKELNIGRATSLRIIDKLLKKGIINKISYKTEKQVIYIFRDLLNLL